MTSIEQHQSRTEALAAAAAAQAVTVYTAFQAGRLTRDQAEVLIAAVVNAANAAAVSLADVGLQVQIEAATGLPAPATGVIPTDDAHRLEKSVHTIFDEDQPDAQTAEVSDDKSPTQMRIERLARSEGTLSLIHI